MEFYVDEYPDSFISIKIIGIGASGESASNYFSGVGNELFPERLIVSDKDDIADLQVKIADVDWLFMITDVEDLELAEKVDKIIEKTKTSLGYQFPLITFLILCSSADDVRLADIPDSFGTWIVLPEDKVAETGLTSNELIYRTINVTVSMHVKGKFNPLNHSEINYVFGMDIVDFIETIGNFGRACIGFGESFNSPLDAVKNALQSPLFIEDIGKAKKVLLIFVVRRELYESKFINMMEMYEAANFLYGLFNPDPEDVLGLLFQTIIDENFSEGVTAFVLATNFDFRNGGRNNGSL